MIYLAYASATTYIKTNANGIKSVSVYYINERNICAHIMIDVQANNANINQSWACSHVGNLKWISVGISEN